MIALLEKLDSRSSSEEVLQGAPPESALWRQVELWQGAGTVPGLHTFEGPVTVGVRWLRLFCWKDFFFFSGRAQCLSSPATEQLTQAPTAPQRAAAVRATWLPAGGSTGTKVKVCLHRCPCCVNSLVQAEIVKTAFTWLTCRLLPAGQLWLRELFELQELLKMLSK